MKTCLYCGGNNNDSANVCVICGRDLHTGEKADRDTLMEKTLAVRSLPRPESPYTGLVLLGAILSLILLGLAVLFEPSMEWFYDLRLPHVQNVGGIGGGLLICAAVLLFVMIFRMVKLLNVHKGYFMILRADGGDVDEVPANMYKRYRRRATGFLCLLWLLPVALFALLTNFIYMGSIAYYVEIAGVSIRLPDIQDPVPYLILTVLGLIFVGVQFGFSLKTTVAYRRYEAALQGKGKHKLTDARSGLAAALDARYYPQPETPQAYFLLIPAIVTFLLFGLAVIMGPALGSVAGVALPVFAHPGLIGEFMIGVALALGIAMLACFVKQKTVTRGYFEAMKMDKDTPFSPTLEKYAHYQKQACDFYCFLWLLPVVLLAGIMYIVYISSYARTLTLLGQYRFILPKVEQPLPYMLLAAVAAIFQVILFFVTWSKSRAFRHADAANRKRRHEEEKARALEEEKARVLAEAEAAAAAETAEATEEEGSLWGDYSVTAEGETPADETSASETPAGENGSPLEDFGFFLDGDASYEPVTPAAPADPDQPDVLEHLRGIDVFDASAATSTRGTSRFRELCDWFIRYAKSQGFEPEMASVRALLSAMSTSRVVFIRPHDEAAAEFAPKVAKFFGTNTPVADVSEDWATVESLLFTGAYHSKRASDCLCGMYRATYAPDSFCVLTLTNADAAADKGYLADLLAYAAAPERNRELHLMDEMTAALPAHASFCQKTDTREAGVYMTMPANIWCLVITSDPKKFCAPSAGYTTGSALTVSLRGKACEVVEEEHEHEHASSVGLSTKAFNRMSSGVMENYFLPEEQWKKFDRIEAFLNERAGVRFDNRLMLRLEQFSSTYMTSDPDINHVLDAMLESTILPLIAELDPAALQSIDGSAGICETMALAFGADNIPCSLQALHELGFEA